MYAALHRDVSLHTLFTTVYVHMYASIPGCGCIRRESTNTVDQQVDQQLLQLKVTLENKYVSPPAPQVECWYFLARHTSAPCSSPPASLVHLAL